MGRVKELYAEMLENGYESLPRGERFVCPHHFNDPYLSAYVAQHTESGTCSYCGRQGSFADMSDVVEHIGFVVKMYFNNLDEECLPLASTYFDDKDEVIPGIKRVGCFAAPAEADDYLSTPDLLDALNAYTDSDSLNDDIDNVFID